ncbi:hypothetical protein [Mangrovibacterium diazotrophicum]|uniref:Uncharacterized protein n=1 Tax=Mangrovibacterium diazotrophicum TaxID=1261403 RepID=A0A419WB80_9BACT|nr:hypothetical protein [Mangrovibacterium diazotrophicum]RKD92740.1 hypothetical protein BC643_3117 [Mangrovibacterium diazotrophicum]
MENWYPGFEKKVVGQLQGAKERDLRFFRVEEYLRNAERIDGFAPKCRECYSYRNEMEKMADDVVTAVQTPGKERRELDRIQSGVNDHMRKAHGFYPPYYHTYTQSAYWTLGFMLAAFMLTFAFPSIEKVVFYSPAFAIGVVTGQIIGGRKDRKIRDSEKIL